MLILTNLPGAAIITISLIVAISILFSFITILPNMITFDLTFGWLGGSLALLDLAYRFRIKNVGIWTPKGGSIFWIPIWLIGCIILFLILMIHIVSLFS